MMSTSYVKQPPVSASGEKQKQKIGGEGKPNHDIVKLNDAVYQAYRPDGNPRAQVVFFHDMRKLNFQEAYKDTWMSLDGSQCWPQVWLPRYFSRAAVYLVSYDSSASVDSTHGRLDLHTAAEQLLHSLLLAKIGQLRSCPLILVGHGLGGIIIKSICLRAHLGASSRNDGMSMFLKQIRGVFFFSTPHGGSHPKQRIFRRFHTVSDMMAAVEPFNKEVSRCADEFQKLRQFPQYKWKTRGVHHSHGPKKGQLYSSPEAGGRLDVDEFFVADGDSDSICKPTDESASSFQFLVQFIRELVVSFASKHRGGLPFSRDRRYVPIMKTIKEVHKLLQTKKIVVLYGETGTGKTSLAKHVALQYENHHDSMFWDGCYFVECGRKSITSIQKDLLRQMGVDSSDVNDLSTQMRHLDALIVLDDVWEHDTVRKHIVPGSNVKLLVTAQPSDVWKDDDQIACCMMEKISYDYGRQIIVKRVGFPGGSLPEEIEGIVRDLLNATDCHPLALATLSMAVQTERRTVREEWDMVKRSMDTLLKEGVAPVAFGQKYPRGVYASMMYGMELLYDKSRDSLALLCIIALFQGPSVPMKWIQTFVKETDALRLPDEDGADGVYRLIKQLGGRSLLQLRIERQSKDVHVSMNVLRQRFILYSEKGHVATVRQEILKLLPCFQGSSSQKLVSLPSGAGSSYQIDSEKGLGTYIYQGLPDTDRLIQFSRAVGGAASTVITSHLQSFQFAFPTLSNVFLYHKNPAEALEMLGALTRNLATVTGDVGKTFLPSSSGVVDKEKGSGPLSEPTPSSSHINLMQPQNHGSEFQANNATLVAFITKFREKENEIRSFLSRENPLSRTENRDEGKQPRHDKSRDAGTEQRANQPHKERGGKQETGAKSSNNAEPKQKAVGETKSVEPKQEGGRVSSKSKALKHESREWSSKIAETKYGAGKEKSKIADLMNEAVKASSSTAEPKQGGGKGSLSSLEPKHENGKGNSKSAEPKKEAVKGSSKTAEPNNDALKRSSKTVEQKNDDVKGSSKTAEPKNQVVKGSVKTAEPKNEAIKGSSKGAESNNEAVKGSLKTTVPKKEAREGTSKSVEPKHENEKGSLKSTEPKNEGVKFQDQRAKIGSWKNEI